LHFQTYIACIFSEDFEPGLNSPDNNVGFYAETTATNKIHDAQRRFNNEILSAAACKNGEYKYFRK